MADNEFCCKMREKYVVSIVGVAENIPEPVDIVDHLDFDIKSPNGFPIIYLSYCAFCGAKIPRDGHRRLIEPAVDDEDDGADNWKSSVAD